MNTEFILTKTFPFEAAHQLKYHDGKCARLHGHSFKLTVVIAGSNTVPELIHEPDVVMSKRKPTMNPKSNMLLDYGIISDIVKPFVEEKLDHHFLNETLETDSPTSEYIASYCFGSFSSQFRKAGVILREIRISETCTSEAIYRSSEKNKKHKGFRHLSNEKLFKMTQEKLGVQIIKAAAHMNPDNIRQMADYFAALNENEKPKTNESEQN